MITALETQGLCKNFGALPVTREVALKLPAGARHALIGPNGAGKTTLINLLTGTFRPTSGRILLNGEDITHLPAAARVKRGIARTFQINSLFNGLSVLDSLTLAVAERRGLAWDMLRPVRAHRTVNDEAMQLLQSLKLETEARRTVRELAYGQQRLVEIAIALALRPRVLLLDEPAAGVPTHEATVILDAIAALPTDITILMIEHDMNVVFRFASRITVLVHGSILMEGTPAEISENPQVREVYLGTSLYG